MFPQSVSEWFSVSVFDYASITYENPLVPRTRNHFEDRGRLTHVPWYAARGQSGVRGAPNIVYMQGRALRTRVCGSNGTSAYQGAWVKRDLSVPGCVGEICPNDLRRGCSKGHLGRSHQRTLVRRCPVRSTQPGTQRSRLTPTPWYATRVRAYARR